MAATKQTARCHGCSALVSTKSARNHLTSCIQRAGPGPNGTVPSMILVTATGDHPSARSAYLLCALLPGNATLRHIDNFLRKHWLECCGHLSLFRINGVRHHSDGFDEHPGMPASSMDQQAARVLTPHTEAHYEYDMGSTTHLRIRVSPAPAAASEWLRQHQLDPAAPVMQNIIPETCTGCGGPAGYTSSPEHTDWPDHRCDRCLPSHPVHYRPLDNSPRDGTGCFDDDTPLQALERSRSDDDPAWPGSPNPGNPSQHLRADAVQ